MTDFERARTDSGPPATAAELTALADELAVDEEVLDEAVHQVKGDEAAALNNEGRAAQLAFICHGMTAKRARLYLTDLSHTHREETA